MKHRLLDLTGRPEGQATKMVENHSEEETVATFDLDDLILEPEPIDQEIEQLLTEIDSDIKSFGFQTVNEKGEQVA